METIDYKSLLIPAFQFVSDEIEKEACSEVWLKGGRGSTKSSFISLEIVLGLLQNPGANAIVYRKVASTLRESVYPQIQWAIHALGRRGLFSCKVSPMEITYEKTGQKILFRGADDPGKSKSLKLSQGYFKYLWFEELTEFDGMEDIQTIKASVLRGSDERTITFYSYNPPRSVKNWVNAEALVPAPGRLCHHSDYTMVPGAWLGAAFIAQAETMKQTNEKAYRNMYLGEVTGSGGQVFRNLALRTITKEERSTFDRLLCGGDFGFGSDPDAFLLMHYQKATRSLFILNELYAHGLHADELAKRVATLTKGRVICDSEDPRMINELKRRGIRALGAKKGPGSVAHGMRWLQDLGSIIIDPVACPNAAREFTAYEYRQDKSGCFQNDYPDAHNHTIDAARYGVEELANARVAKTVKREAYGF